MNLADRLAQMETTLGRDACWQWPGAIRRDGYVSTRWEYRPGVAHRFAFKIVRGDVADDLELDHLCRNRACVNPWHLEPVTKTENMRRGVSPWAMKARQTHCKHGHEFTDENTRRESSGRKCIECGRRRMREYMRRSRARRRVQGDRLKTMTA